MSKTDLYDEALHRYRDLMATLDPIEDLIDVACAKEGDKALELLIGRLRRLKQEMEADVSKLAEQMQEW